MSCTWVGAGSASYAKQANKHCSKNTTGSTFTSLSAAKDACTSSKICSGVYDNGCDGKNSFKMCQTGIVYGPSSSKFSSCVYRKSNGTCVVMHARARARAHGRCWLVNLNTQIKAVTDPRAPLGSTKLEPAINVTTATLHVHNSQILGQRAELVR